MSRNPPDSVGTYTWTQAKDKHGGTFAEEGQGIVVSLSDSPCDYSDPESPSCPPATRVCGHIRRPRMCPFQDTSYCPLAVTCGGATAKYVRVQLPGKNRILDAQIRVQRHRPKAVLAMTE